MAAQGFHDLKCEKCGRKLAEYSLIDGEIRIECRHNYGRGRGPCNYLNVIEVRKGAKSNNKFSKDAI